MAEFRIFPDIRLIIGRADEINPENAVEISFCRNGLCEYEVDNEYYYLTAKNCVILRHEAAADCHISYSSNYCGVTLLIDSNYNCNAFSEILDIPDMLRNMQSLEQCIFTADDNIQRLFSEIYDTSNTSMLRIKILELLMLAGEKRSTIREKVNVFVKLAVLFEKNCVSITLSPVFQNYLISTRLH